MATEPQTIFVAVGSLRQPKLDAVRSALALCGDCLSPGSRFETTGAEVASGVRSTPLSRNETMRGAKNRAEALRRVARERREPWSYFVGLEGGLEVTMIEGARCVFLESWACVANPSGAVYYGQSGAITLPEELAGLVVDRGMELSDAIDAFAGTSGIRDGLGAWGVLTRGRITREDAFRIAVINALAPFFGLERKARLIGG